MSHTTRRLAILSLALALAAPLPANAQLGGLMKKARKAMQHQDNPASGGSLTDALVRSTLKGIEAQLPILNQRDAMSKQRDAAVTERSKLFDAHSGEGEAYSDADSKNAICRDSVFTLISDQRQADMANMGQQIAADPQKRAALMQQEMAMQQKAQQMMQAGDTAGARKFQMQAAMAMAGVDLKADTAKVDKACGRPPAKPAWLVKADDDADLADTLNARMQRVEEKAVSDGIRASGLTADQFNQVRERIVTWWAQQGGPNPNEGFTKEEVAILGSHRAEIEKLESIF
jgi:hypothetical protein